MQLKTIESKNNGWANQGRGILGLEFWDRPTGNQMTRTCRRGYGYLSFVNSTTKILEKAVIKFEMLKMLS
jgi:hypothetical protein